MTKIDDEYMVESDGIQFILLKKIIQKNKEKEPYFKQVAYCGTLQQAVTAYSRRKQLEAFMCDDFKKILSALESIEEVIRSIRE